MVYIPTELLVEILVRLPWTSRRRMRLVCRSWRNIIHKRTSEMQQRRDAVPLVVTTESAYLLEDDPNNKSDDYEAACIPRALWPGRGPYKLQDMAVVGVCNGVLCLCDDNKPGGAITLANPATGDVLALPPIPCAGLFRRHNTRSSGRTWHQAYSFAFHHATGQYKVVHVPCFFKTKETLQVFTLGEASWREVPAPNAKCRLDAGVVSANGATYWVAEGSEEKIVSFDLVSEQVKPTKPVPMAARPIRHLTEVQRRLSTATILSQSIKVWILESTDKEQAWIHQYTFSVYPPHGKDQLPRPNFIHGEYLLILGGQGGQKLLQYRHRPVNYVTSSGAVHTRSCWGRALVPDIRGHVFRTFGYIKTTEALSVYRLW